MFDTLLVSRAVGAPWTRAVPVALVVHILLIAGAVGRTASPTAGVKPVARDTIRLELVEVRPPPRRPARPPGLEPIVPAPFETPDFIPPPLEFERPPFSYIPPGRPQTGPGNLPPGSTASGSAPDTMRLIFGTTEVDELPELVVQPDPRYPDGLRRAGVSGFVRLQFVVRIDGKVDERSVRVLTSSHPGFTLSAFQALRESRFRPARRGGRPAAVLVEQVIRFSYR